MESSGKLSYIFRKYSLVRASCALVLLVIALVILYFVTDRNKPIPVIDSINPPVGSPGDVVVLEGKNFGEIRDMSYVEIAGSKLTATSYISWDDNCIKLVLPSNVQDGLVVVGVNHLRSKPVLFANEVDIPVLVTQTFQVTKPVITSLSSGKLNVGQLLTIYGNNFGASRGQSKVYFTCDYEKAVSTASYVTTKLLTDNMICASEFDEDYEYWANNEIRVRVPDGAYTGVIVIDTGKEKSLPMEFEVIQTAGTKSFNNKKIYLVQYSADVSDVVADDVSTITLRCPVPVIIPSQPTLEFTEITPAPVLQNYQNNIIHQISKNRNNSPKSVFRQNFVLPVYEINSTVNAAKIGAYKNVDQSLVNKYTKADVIVPADEDRIKELSAEILGKETNAYRKARLIYNYMLKNFTVLPQARKDDSDPLDLIKNGAGDAYDMAVVFAAICRASGIPAMVDTGVLVSQDLICQAHWWNEIYIPSVGWIPVDSALGADMEYKKWPETVDVQEYYFGNIDAHHIAFTRGYNDIKPFTQDNKIVKYPRSFALQSIWEEASNNTAQYSSYWSVPVIKGLY